MNKKTFFLINPFYGFRSCQDYNIEHHKQFENGHFVSQNTINLYDDLKLTIEIYDLRHLTIDFIENDDIKFVLSEKNNYIINKKSAVWLNLEPLIQAYIVMVSIILKNKNI